jgi:hypothetical protein
MNSIGILTRPGIRPEKKKGKRKKADDVSKTANQKGKGPENAMVFQFFAFEGFIYPCLFAHQLETSRLPFLN